tara:strand:- start:177 stop:455 length:279 start_codon:yes stop_codon:yes gene_type:complete
MRAYYVIDYDGLHKSPTIHIPEGLNKEQAATYVYGEMMLEYWTLDTPHAIYLSEDKGYEFAEGDDDVDEKVHAGLLLEDKLIAELDRQDLSS